MLLNHHPVRNMRGLKAAALLWHTFSFITINDLGKWFPWGKKKKKRREKKKKEKWKKKSSINVI